MRTVAQRRLDHTNCYFSTGVCDEITAGQGKRDRHGYFEIDCPECAAKMANSINQRNAAVFTDG